MCRRGQMCCFLLLGKVLHVRKCYKRMERLFPTVGDSSSDTSLLRLWLYLEIGSLKWWWVKVRSWDSVLTKRGHADSYRRMITWGHREKMPPASQGRDWEAKSFCCLSYSNSCTWCWHSWWMNSPRTQYFVSLHDHTPTVAGYGRIILVCRVFMVRLTLGDANLNWLP